MRSPGRPLPTAFTRDAALAVGWTGRQLEGYRFRLLTRGAYAWAGVQPRPAELCRALSSLLPPGSGWSHQTAAELLGLPRVGAPRLGRTLHVTVLRAAAVPRRHGLTAHRAEILPGDLALVDGVPVTSMPRTFVDHAAAVDLEQLVAIGDAMIRSGRCTAAELARRVAAAAGHRGVRRARRALSLLDPRAASVPESVMRVRIVDAGMPAPTPQLNVVDSRGRWIARVDLGYEQERIAIEYEGRQHAERDQFARDIDRYSSLSAAGWRVLREGAADHAAGGQRMLAQLGDLLSPPSRSQLTTGATARRGGDMRSRRGDGAGVGTRSVNA
ncbi:MAG: DUF559 domain-containing protein [Mycobacteriales bacterium]|nr:MAG: hypothetical protein DLM56_07780 [Pseudonocardiales bacterium]